jgi:hypothetical protein
MLDPFPPRCWTLSWLSKKRSGVQTFFFYNHLCRNSIIRNIIMESNANLPVKAATSSPIESDNDQFIRLGKIVRKF